MANLARGPCSQACLNTFFACSVCICKSIAVESEVLEPPGMFTVSPCHVFVACLQTCLYNLWPALFAFATALESEVLEEPGMFTQSPCHVFVECLQACLYILLLALFAFAQALCDRHD